MADATCNVGQSAWDYLGFMRVLAEGVGVGGSFEAFVVADVGALHPEDYVFGDVGGVVGYALEVAGYEQRVERLAYHFRTLVHRLH